MGGGGLSLDPLVWLLVSLFEVVLLEVDSWALRSQCQGLPCKPIVVHLIVHGNLVFSSWGKAADGQTSLWMSCLYVSPACLGLRKARRKMV